MRHERVRERTVCSTVVDCCDLRCSSGTVVTIAKVIVPLADCGKISSWHGRGRRRGRTDGRCQGLTLNACAYHLILKSHMLPLGNSRITIGRSHRRAVKSSSSIVRGLVDES